MKKVSLSVIILVIISSVFLMISSVSADTGKTIMARGNLQDAINEAASGDIIQLTDKSYETSVNIDKNITIKGPISGRSVLTTFNIVNGADKVKLENILVSTRMNKDFTLIDVQTQVELEIANFRLIFASSGKDGNEDPWNIDSKIIHMSANSSNSKLNIHDSYLAGMFDTLNVESSGNTIEITKTTINSDCPIILRNGSNNNVTVTGCEIVAGSSYIPSEEECISIIKQNGTTIDFIDTTLKGMKIPAEKNKTNDLISFDDANSTNVKVNFKGSSKIIDGNMVKGSDIFNFGACPVDSGNTIYLENSVQVFINNGTDHNPELQEATLEEKYNTSENYYVVGVYDNYGATIKQYQKNELITEDALPKKVAGEPGIPGKLGCDISNWYTNKDLSNEFKPTETPIDKNMNLYPKYVDLVYVTIGEYNFELQKGQNLSNIDKDLTNATTVEDALNSIKQEKVDRFSRFVDYEGNTVERETTTFEKNDEITAKFNVKVTVNDILSQNKEITLEEGKSLDDLDGENKTYIDGIKSAENFSRFVDEEGNTLETSEPIEKDKTINVKHNVKLSFKGTDLVVDVEEESTLQDLTEEERKVLEKLEVVEGKDFHHFEDEEGNEIDKQKTFTKDTELIAKYTVTVTIGNEEFTFDEGKALEDLEGEDQNRFDKIINQDGKTFSHFEKADGSRVEKSDKIYFHTKLTPKYTVKVKVTLNGMNIEFDLNENQSLNDLDEEKAAELDALILKDDKTFVNFVDGQGKLVNREDSISKNCELTPKYKVTVKIKDKLKTFTLNEGENLNNLESGELSILGLLIKGENKTFSHFENESSEKILYDTAINSNVTLTPKYTVDITIGVKKFTINEGETLNNLDDNGKAVLEILKQDKEDFSRFIDEDGNTIETTTPIKKHTTIGAKFNMTITVKGTELSFKLEEGKKLSELKAEEIAKLEELKNDKTKTFVKFVDASGKEVTMDQIVTTNIELTPKYVITVTINGQTFTINEGESLDNLNEQDKTRLDNLLKVSEKTFSHFVNEKNARVDKNTTISENTTLTPKYTVTVTIGSKVFTINENDTLNNLDELGKQALNELQNSKNNFSRFVDAKGNTIELTTKISKNVVISAKFNVIVTIKGKTFTLEEGQNLNNLSSANQTELNNLITVAGKTFSHFVDSNNVKIYKTTSITKDITLTPKYTVTVTIKGKVYTLEEGQNLNNLTSAQQTELNNLITVSGKTFSHFVDSNNTRIEKTTPISKNTVLTPKYTVTVTVKGKVYTLQEGQNLNNLTNTQLAEIDKLVVASNKTFSHFVNQDNNKIERTTAINKNTVLTPKYTVTVTIKNLKFIIYEGRTLNDLSSENKTKLEKLKKGEFWQRFSKFIDSTTKATVSNTTAITKNTTLEVVFENIEESVATNSTKGVIYTTHVQDIGWQSWVPNGKMAGTTGKCFRLEGIKIKVQNLDETGGIIYNTHVQDIGWQGWKADGDIAGTSGKALRLEAIKINLTGALAKKYDVYYRVHAQDFGWLGWAKNGESAGTAGYGYRLEGIEIKLVLKGSTVPGSTINAFHQAPPKVVYQTHVQDVGWQKEVKNGATAGTSGRALRLEGIRITLGNNSFGGGITYSTHVQDIGWQGWKSNGDMSGTSGRSLRLEAIKIKLTGEIANKYDIYYRVHSQDIGWMGWAKNGESAGTAGYSYRLEAIQIVLVQKGGKAPGTTTGAFKSK